MSVDVEFATASKLTVIVDGDKKYDGRLLYKEIQGVFRTNDVQGFTMTRGIESFGSSRVIHSLRSEVTATNLPFVFEAIDEKKKIRSVAETIAGMLGLEGIVQIQPTWIST